MSKKNRNITLNVESLIGNLVVITPDSLTEKAQQQLRQQVQMQVTEGCIVAITEALKRATRQQYRQNERECGGHCSKCHTRPQQSVQGNGKCKGVLPRERVQMCTNNRLPHTPVEKTGFWLWVPSELSILTPSRECRTHGQFRREALY